MSVESIKERLTKLLTQNIGLKIASIIAAAVLWFIVVNITDPVISDQIKNVPVDIINEVKYIDEAGKTLEVLDGTDMISSVTIRAPRSVISELGNNPENFTAIADMRYLSADETEIPIDITASKYADKIESVKPSIESVKVRIENKRTIQLPIYATTSGEIESGYVIGTVTQAQNQIKITGPQSTVSEIEKASVDVQVTGFKEKISTSADVMLFDADGNEIDSSNLEMNVTSVRVDVEILATKKVPVIFESTGIPADNYDVTGEINSDIDEVIIAGTSQAVDKIEKIEVPETALNVTGLSSSLRAVINLAEYLPNGIRFADSNFAGYANVTVYIEEYQEKSFSTYLKNVDVTNIPDGFESNGWDEDKDYVEFTLVGLAQDLEKVQISDLNFSVDFNDYALMNDISGFKAGVYELPLLMDLPENVWMKEPVGVKVLLVK